MAVTIVDRLHKEFQALVVLLDREVEPSIKVTADDTFRKVLLLSAASHFERVVTDAVLGFVSEASTGNERVVEFVRRQGLNRGYHTLFEWDGKNANKFFGLFGEAFREAMGIRLKEDEKLTDAIKAFLELGRDRNRLIHEDLGQFVLEKTAAEIFALYELAAHFVDALPDLLRMEEPQGERGA
jgi:hypothetical protein